MPDHNEGNQRTGFVRRATSAVGRAPDVTSKKLRRVTDKAKESASKVTQVTRNAQTSLLDSTIETLEQLQAAPGRLSNLVFRKSPVPTFLLPIGPDLDDFFYSFQFDEVISRLTSGTFVRPVIEVWAGRQDFDRARFAERLTNEFIRQFTTSRAKAEHIRAETERKLAEIKPRKRRAAVGAGRATAVAVTASLLSPIGGPLALAIAVFGASAAIKPTLEYLQLSKETKGHLRQQKTLLREVNARLNHKDAAFRRAVSKLRVQVHPELQELTKLICDVEGISFLPQSTEKDTASPPSVRPHLTNSDYVKQLPEEYKLLVSNMLQYPTKHLG